MSRLVAALAAFMLAVPVAVAAQGAGITVTVNGSPVAFDQPPVERVGRVYVPLRGVFEQLGATVVYDNGTIQATRGSTTLSLQIGSTSAIVNGTQTALDSPPFLIGARTLVPLRFIAQALGATVDYNGNTRTVAIGSPAGPRVVVTPPPAPAPPPPPPPPPAQHLIRIEPDRDATVAGARPQIAGTFPVAVDPNDVRVRLDDRDVTPNAYVSARAFSYDPQFDLPYGSHHVSVRAPGVEESWTFTNVAATNPNFLTNLAPANGTVVPEELVVSGTTRAASRVQIVATTNLAVGFNESGQNTVVVDTVAGPDGHFARPLHVPGFGFGGVDVRITSTAPDGAIVVRTLRLRLTPH